MRPLRIELEGFSAYRDKVVVDFEGVDFFSLAGPTGSGKSSLIDAMVFALYGRVPRLGGNAVAPAITAGSDRARVRFDFEVGNEGFTAARMAQRTSSGGASVKEARLQEGDRVLADGADDVTRSVEGLLRMSFDDFTRTVVLPQGEFARFLTATKSERQGLLRSLLGLDVYTRVRELARTRQAVATERAEATRRALDQLEVPDPETARAMVERLESLRELGESIGDSEKELADLDAAISALRDEEERLVDAMSRLESVRIPPDLEDHDRQMVEARSRLVDAAEAVEAAGDRVKDLKAQLEDLPTQDQMNAWRRTQEQIDSIVARLAGSSLDDAREILAKATADRSESEAALASARTALDDARTTHAAHELAGRLEVGEPCPVCAQTVAEIPTVQALPELDALEAVESSTSEAVAAARDAETEARSRLAAQESAVAELKSQEESLRGDLELAPDDLDSVGSELETTRGRLEEAETDLADCAAAHEQAEKSLADLAEASRRISRELTAAQVDLAKANLDPPVSESDDPAVQWKELSIWRDETLDDVANRRSALLAKIDEANKTARRRRDELISRLRAAGLEAIEPFAVEVATAIQTARATVEAHEKALSESQKLGEDLELASVTSAVAGALVNHLRADGFERWMMVGALTELVVGANELLGELSGGGYSLHTDDSGDFSIIDHRNADERRSVATLSGGETFLVSLALALSLAETLAAKGGSGLDAIILDEGFGTLDDESLDTVAAVLEELAGSGLMVGVITHVKELAARAPVRYEVTREPQGASVRLVS